MNFVSIVTNWSSELVFKIKNELQKNQYSNFIKNNATKQQFWYAYVWYFLFFENFSNRFPQKTIKQFFQEGDRAISLTPDLFNDELYMEAHGLLWFYKFETFYENIQQTFSLSAVLF